MDWTVDYGSGPTPVTIPHSWHQDVDVRWEGPAIYRTSLVASEGDFLRFWGVSYACTVSLNGEEVCHHEGIWDAFDVPLVAGPNSIEVRVVKNGGPTYPVREVLSGFLPFVFHTFGGIFRPVERLSSSPYAVGGGGERSETEGVDSPSPREGEVRERSERGGGEFRAEAQRTLRPPSPSFHSGTPPCKQGG